MKILFNNKYMPDIEIKDADNSAFSAGRLMAAVALFARAKYGEVKASASYNIVKYNADRYIADHMDIDLEAEVNDEDLNEHQAVVKRPARA